MQPLVFSTTLFISSILKSTGIKTSALSAVPQAEVIALEEVFGIVKPEEAIRGTRIKEVLSPTALPMLCLSTTIFLFKSRVFPVLTIAKLKFIASSISKPEK